MSLSGRSSILSSKVVDINSQRYLVRALYRRPAGSLILGMKFRYNTHVKMVLAGEYGPKDRQYRGTVEMIEDLATVATLRGIHIPPEFRNFVIKPQKPNSPRVMALLKEIFGNGSSKTQSVAPA